MNRETDIDAPELLYRIKCDDFFEKIVPVVALVHVSMRTKSMLWGMEGCYLSTGRLGEPQSPLMHQGMLDVEILWIVENSDLLVSRLCSAVF